MLKRTQPRTYWWDSKEKAAEICDDCATVAYDRGVVDDWNLQVEMMVTLGDELPDHLCTAKEEPSIGIECRCGCNY